MQSTIERTRIGDKLRVVKEMPARVDFSDILDTVKLEPDHDHDFFDCDGLEHEVHTVWKDGQEDARGHFYSDNARGSRLITIDKERAARDMWGLGNSSGASKQVCAELLAANIQNTTDWIRKVYTDQVSAVGIVCDFTAPDGEVYHASCWGFESENPWNDAYIESEREAIAGEVAAQLEAAGFEVIGERESAQSVAVQNHKNRTGVNGDNWKGDYQSRRDAIARHNRRHNRKK